MYVCVYIYIYTHMYIYTHTCMYACVYTYIYIYDNNNTNTTIHIICNTIYIRNTISMFFPRFPRGASTSRAWPRSTSWSTGCWTRIWSRTRRFLLLSLLLLLLVVVVLYPTVWLRPCGRNTRFQNKHQKDLVNHTVSTTCMFNKTHKHINANKLWIWTTLTWLIGPSQYIK